MLRVAVRSRLVALAATAVLVGALGVAGGAPRVVSAARSAGSAARQAVAWPVVGRGTTSAPAQVRSVQYLLDAHGAVLAASGVYGARTAAAVRTFQRGVGLPPTGVVAAPTWRRLVVTCSLGTVGSAVRALQQQLNAYDLKGAALAVDGIFGPRTQRAVLAFQRSRHLVADGVVGRVTWRYLVSMAMSG